MKYIKTFKQISKKDIAMAGGKGASLGEMANSGFKVPPGFVVLAGAFDRFLEETDINVEIEAILKRVNHKDINSVNKASAKIKDLIMNVEMPEDLGTQIQDEYRKFFSPSPSPSRQGRGRGGLAAIRSSATAEDSKVASWAGELETYLNVTNKNLLGSVKKCWASLFTPRAIFYGFEKGFYQKSKRSTPSPVKGEGKRLGVSVAVVVQKMVQSEISGICFTVHPVTKDKNQLVIEAGFGLGEAIVGGEITPDTYVIHKKDFSILDINVSEQNMMVISSAKAKPRRGTRSGHSTGGTTRKKLAKQTGSKQKLTKQQMVRLAKICKKIETHYNHPQDIEWALENNKFFITQSRPITTL